MSIVKVFEERTHCINVYALFKPLIGLFGRQALPHIVYSLFIFFRSNAKFVELLQREPELWYDVAASPVLASLTPEQSEQSKICNFSSEHVTRHGYLNSIQIP